MIARNLLRASLNISRPFLQGTPAALLLGCFTLLSTVTLPVQAQSSYPLLNAGSTGESVSQLQATLKLLGFYQGAVDGIYSEPTINAVAQFQTSAGIAADGVAGPSTWQALLPTPDAVIVVAAPPVPVAPPQPIAASNPVPPGPPVLRMEAAGPAVSQLQRELQTLGYYNGPIDGGFGEATFIAVEQFQIDQQLFVDGVVGQSTWDALSRALEM